MPGSVNAGRPREDDASTLNSELSEPSVDARIVDKNHLGWDNLRVSSPDTHTVLEAWEMILVGQTTEVASARYILGMNVASVYRVLKDGYVGVRAVPSYSQSELANMIAAAESEWNTQRSGFLPFVKRDTYCQHLAKRIFRLPGCLPSKLGALLDCRFMATNKSPYVRREWTIAMLKPINEVMTEEGRRRKGLGLWSRRNGGREDPVRKWLIVLRGQETRTSEQGFAAFDTLSNPWLRVDEEMQQRREVAIEKSV
ncbi:hypothetical protein F5Y19DRAFT_466986 [Xylariaceae sp. FL1651]|nr:hypothetical protein F5Y19DRAFT_466986 [Xylariaceae sp. FL1651]